jgi:hypothetical protein
MARVTGFLESMSGKIGNIVIVHRGNKTFIQRRPGKREKKPTPEQVRVMDIFSLAGKIARSICSIDELKYFWPYTRWNNRSSYVRLFKANYNQLDIEDLSGGITLTDLFGFDLIEPSINIGEDGITLEAGISRYTGLDNNKELKDIIAAGVIILKSPSEEWMPKYDLLAFKSEKKLFKTEKRITFPCLFKGEDLGKFTSYSIKKAFMVLITLDKDGNPLLYSRTFSN